MATLLIEHAIADFRSWKAAFDRFADVRERAGVRGHRILNPVDDPKYVVIELEFDTAEEADRFLGFLRDKIWPSPENAPALVGAPRATVLVSAEPDQHA